MVRYALLVVAAPLIWMAWDLIVTGEPLYSLTSTREVSGQFGRNRGLFEAITLIPQYSGGNDRIVTVVVGGMGLILAVYILRRRATLPLALGGLGVLTFLIIAAAGLSVIPRYMQIPSLLLTLCVAVALGGWTPDQGAAPAADRDRRRHRLRARRRLARALLRAGLPEARGPGQVRRGPAQGAQAGARRAARGRGAAELRADHRPRPTPRSR